MCQYNNYPMQIMFLGKCSAMLLMYTWYCVVQVPCSVLGVSPTVTTPPLRTRQKCYVLTEAKMKLPGGL